MPVFYTIKTSTAVTTHDGVPVLIGMHSPMPDDVAVSFRWAEGGCLRS